MAKVKKKNLSEAAQLKRSQQNKKQLNPFEVHINKDKQKVLGRKSKTDKGLPGVSRAKAIKKRKFTLLQEYKLKNKENVFLDKRIGEKNVAMSEEDKAMARFAAERMRAHKKQNIYNLNDEEVLTHKGQTLEEIEKFDDPKSDDEFSDDEDRSGKLDKKFVEDAHFGGGILSKSDSMSRKDLIEQLIAESKKRKAEKQKIREQTMDLTEKLDSEWRDLLPIVSAAKKTEDQPAEKSKVDDYDMEVRKLKFEARGHPSEKLKSEEEIIKEETEKLQALEADRLARMKGFIDNPSNEVRHKSADDLDDGFMLEKIEDETSDKEDTKDEHTEHDSEKDADTSGDEDDNDDNEEIVETENAEISAEDESEAGEASEEDAADDDLSDLKESESSDEDEAGVSKKHVKFADQLVQDSEQFGKVDSSKLKSILKMEKEEEAPKSLNKDREQEIRNDLLKRKEIMEQARKELPYTYKAPESFEELQNLLQDRNPDYQSIIVDRIIKCNHWTLDGKNKEKLSNLFVYLLQHINDCASIDETEDTIQCFQVFDRLCPYLYDLAHMNPENAKNCIQEVIKEKHEEFEKNKKKYPELNTLIFFKLISLLFPTSDFRHPVVTPSLVFMSQILLRSRVTNQQDVSKGLFLCTLILEYTVLSKRFAPSVINFLRGITYMATPKHLVQGIKVIPPFKTRGPSSDLLVIDEDQTNLEIDPSKPLMKASDLTGEEVDDEFRIRSLITAVNLLVEFKNQLQELEAAFAIFEPVIKLLKLNPFEKYPTNVRKHIQKIRKDLNSLRDKKLEYIVMEKKKPKPLRLYEPRIEAVHDGRNHKKMSKEQAEREKLLHKYKREMKGAIREIRRDRAFLAKVQIKQQLKSDAERKRKVKEIFGEAAMQQSELNKLKRKKK